MRRVQDELDEVVGRGRLPTLADRPRLPYLEATVREALRWRPVAALGKPGSHAFLYVCTASLVGCLVLQVSAGR